MNKNLSNKHGFTFIELIVVMSIIAILSTIGFIGYSEHLVAARDSNRISQLISIGNGLNTYKIKYQLPEPNDNIKITGNGELIGYQGYMGKSNLDLINYSDGGKDPKDNLYFSYYLSADKRFFQLMAFLETTEDIQTSYNNNFSQKVFADGIDYSNRYLYFYGEKLGILTDCNTNIPIQENLNLIQNGGLDILNSTDLYKANFSYTENKCSSGTTLYTILKNRTVLPVFSTGADCLDYDNYEFDGHYYNISSIQNGEQQTDILSSNIIENNGIYKYTLSSIQCNDGILSNPVEENTPTFINCVDGYTEQSGVCVKATYNISGSFGTTASGADIQVCGENVIADSTGFFSLVKEYGSVCDDIIATKTGYVCNTTTQGPSKVTSNITNISGFCSASNYIVNFDLNGGSGTPTSKNVSYNTAIGDFPNSPTKNLYLFNGWFTSKDGGTQISTGTIIISNMTFYAQWISEYTLCTGTNQIYTGTTTYGSCNHKDILVCSGVGTGYTISACNIGTNIAGTGTNSYGYYYQWGNNYGSISGGPITSVLVDASSYGPGNYYSSSVFIIGSSYYSYDWTTFKNDNLWGNTTNTSEARQGPCLSGYHVPTINEWNGLITAGGGTSNGNYMMNSFYLSPAGYRNRSNGGLLYQNSEGHYWTSSIYGNGSYVIYLKIQNSNFASISPNYNTIYRSYGQNVRCFRNN